MTALLWLRRDLRLHDLPALEAALAHGGPLVPIFCFDPRLLHGRHGSAIRTQLLLDCLRDLAQSLRRRGSGLVLRRGEPEQVIPTVAEELDAATVFWTDDISPLARRRDDVVRARLGRAGREAVSLPGLFCADQPAGILTLAGQPYRVFTPFHRAWLGAPRREPLAPPDILPPLPSALESSEIPTLGELGLEPIARTAPVAGGEREARRQMLAFLSDGLSHYGAARSPLEATASSHLSAHLHLGSISARELEARLAPGKAADAFRRQLGWRDFYAHVLAHWPANSGQEFQSRYRGSLRWSRDQERFASWREGRTGYPLVDAAMRQLEQEGWMHNQLRLVVGSFLTKDLAIDWRWGERWFMRRLLDGDEANNNGNWQWIASVGVDPQPPFRRIYNPTLQLERLDPTGGYVRRYVPELRNVPDQFLAEPWRMPKEIQQRAGCLIGQDYPGPIVDHAAARREALARYAEAARFGS